MEDGKPLARKDAQAVQSYKEAVEALKGMALAPPALPKIVLPTPRTTEERLANKLEAPPFIADPQALPNVQSLLAPPAYLKGGRRADRLVAWADGKLACFTPGDAKPLWSGNALCNRRPASIGWRAARAFWRGTSLRWPWSMAATARPAGVPH